MKAPTYLWSSFSGPTCCLWASVLGSSTMTVVREGNPAHGTRTPASIALKHASGRGSYILPNASGNGGSRSDFPRREAVGTNGHAVVVVVFAAYIHDLNVRRLLPAARDASS